MLMDQNWSRWIFASTSTFFDAKKQGLVFFVEGTDKAGIRIQKDYAVFRLNGPFATELSMGFYELLFDINVLITSMMDTTNTHRIFTNQGIVTQMFQNAIPIYRLGPNDPNPDDQSLIDCALLVTEGSHGGVMINNFGQFDPTLPTQQSTVEGTYRLYITL